MHLLKRHLKHYAGKKFEIDKATDSKNCKNIKSFKFILPRCVKCQQTPYYYFFFTTEIIQTVFVFVTKCM